MRDREYSLVEIIRDPRMWVYEASELTRDGHYYLFRYDGSKGIFYRATVPSGAADIHFHALKATEKIPVQGWQVVERGEFPRNHLELVRKKERGHPRSKSSDPGGRTLSC